MIQGPQLYSLAHLPFHVVDSGKCRVALICLLTLPILKWIARLYLRRQFYSLAIMIASSARL